MMDCKRWANRRLAAREGLVPVEVTVQLPGGATGTAIRYKRLEEAKKLIAKGEGRSVEDALVARLKGLTNIPSGGERASVQAAISKAQEAQSKGRLSKVAAQHIVRAAKVWKAAEKAAIARRDPSILRRATEQFHREVEFSKGMFVGGMQWSALPETKDARRI